MNILPTQRQNPFIQLFADPLQTRWSRPQHAFVTDPKKIIVSKGGTKIK